MIKKHLGKSLKNWGLAVMMNPQKAIGPGITIKRTKVQCSIKWVLPDLDSYTKCDNYIKK